MHKQSERLIEDLVCYNAVCYHAGLKLTSIVGNQVLHQPFRLLMRLNNYSIVQYAGVLKAITFSHY